MLLGIGTPAHAGPADIPVVGSIGAPVSWHSDEFLRDWGLLAIGADYAYARGLSGRNIALGVLDSGMYAGHPEFAGQGKLTALQLGDPSCSTGQYHVIGGCFLTQGDQPSVSVQISPTGPDTALIQAEYGNHGTHVAGTIAAQRDGSGMHGVAFGARLVAAKYFSDSLTTYDPDTNSPKTFNGPSFDEENVEDYYRQLGQHQVHATNMSFGHPLPLGATMQDVRDQYASDKNTFDAFADGAVRHDVITVWALGNAGGAIPGVEAGLPALRTDAEPYWLSVANVKRKPDGSYAIDDSSSICSYTSRWCISAPGTDIYSTVDQAPQAKLTSISGDGSDDSPYTFTLETHQPKPGYAPLTGTSMAAPHVTGALGLLFERFPYLTPPQVRDVLLTTATPLGPEEIYGWGLLNLRKAIDGPGQLLKDTRVTMDRRAGGAKVWEGEAWDDWRNDIGGPGKLVKAGAGWLRLSGSNRFGGLELQQGVLELSSDNVYPATVTGGTLLLNGSLATMRLPVGPDGTLTGHGRVLGEVYMQGTLAPGQADGSGSLAIQGRYVQAPGSRYIAYITPAGASNHLDVTGQAVLMGGQMVVVHAPGNYGLGDSFAVLSATDGVRGKYAGVAQNPLLPFLQFGLRYAPKEVSVDVVRGAALASAAVTPNQRAVAEAADRLPFRQGLPRPLTQLTAAQAPAALSALSGETYASLRSVMFENGRFLRQAALARGNLDSNDSETGRHAQGVWVDAQQANGRLRDHDRVAQASYNGPQLIVGYDYRFDNSWRVGVTGSAGRLSTRTGLGDDGRIRHQSAGIYAGRQWETFGFTAGVTATRHQVEQNRQIRFPGFNDRTHAAYTAHSTQSFMEGTYRISRDGWTIEPYLQWAQMRLRSPGFRENGGVAALSADARSSQVNLATAGTRFQLAFGEGGGWQLRAGLGRRFASGDRQPLASMALGGGDVFVVQGAPLARATTLLQAGIVKALGAENWLALDYSGQFGDQARDHAIRANWSMSF